MDNDKRVVRCVTWRKGDDYHAVIEINRGELVFQIAGYGQGDGKVTIGGTEADDIAKRMADIGIDASSDGTYAIEQLGVCLVYASPTTFGHALADMLENI